MKTKHAKSPCCQVKIYRIGNRRRRCSCCGRTWRIRQKRRGRNPIRLKEELLHRVLVKAQSLQSRRGLSSQVISYRFRKMLGRFVSRQSLQRFPPGPLVLLADGLWFRFRGSPWILHLMALKACSSNVAHFFDPVLLPGREGLTSWTEAFQTISAKLKNRIQAIVCDNVRGLKLLALQHGWAVQLCQFHLISQLHARRGRWKPGIPGQKSRETAYQLLRQCLEEADPKRLQIIIQDLQHTARHPKVPARMRMVVREFIRQIKFFRTYREHPELDLPATTSAMESKGREIRDLLRRARTLRSPSSLKNWVTAYIRLKPTITCNGRHF